MGDGIGHGALAHRKLLPVGLGNGEDQPRGDSAIGFERDDELLGGGIVAQCGTREGDVERDGLPAGAGAAGNGDGLHQPYILDLAPHVLAAAARHEIGAVGEIAVLQHQAGHEVITLRAALGQRDHGLDVVDEPVLGQGLAQHFERNDRLGLALGGGRRGGEHALLALGGGTGGAILDLGHGLGDLADDGAQDGNIGLDAIEATAGIDIGHGVDALAEHGAGLGIGG